MPRVLCCGGEDDDPEAPPAVNLKVLPGLQQKLYVSVLCLHETDRHDALFVSDAQLFYVHVMQDPSLASPFRQPYKGASSWAPLELNSRQKKDLEQLLTGAQSKTKPSISMQTSNFPGCQYSQALLDTALEYPSRSHGERKISLFEQAAVVSLDGKSPSKGAVSALRTMGLTFCGKKVFVQVFIRLAPNEDILRTAAIPASEGAFGMVLWLPAQIDQITWDYSKQRGLPHGQGVVTLKNLSLGNQVGCPFRLKEGGTSRLALDKQKVKISIPQEEGSIWFAEHGSPGLWAMHSPSDEVLAMRDHDHHQTPLPVSFALALDNDFRFLGAHARHMAKIYLSSEEFSLREAMRIKNASELLQGSATLSLQRESKPEMEGDTDAGDKKN
eukprot:3940343-Rhodomonas_salina.3